jgi:hypothetical protein
VRHAHRNANWKDLKHYDLAINTADLSPATVAEMIIQAARDLDKK